MTRNLLGRGEIAAILQEGRNPSGAEGVAADLFRQAGGLGAAFDDPQGGIGCKSLVEESVGRLILVNPEGGAYPRRYTSYILDKIGLEVFKKHLTPHSLRRCFITILHNGGTAPKTLMELARHASLSQTMQYIKIGEEEKTKAIDDVFNHKEA